MPRIGAESSRVRDFFLNSWEYFIIAEILNRAIPKNE